MKRRAALASPKQRPAKRQKSQLAVTQEIVRKELRKNTDWRYADAAATGVAIYTSGAINSLLSNLIRGDAGLNNFQGNMIKPQAITFKYYAQTNQVYNVLRVMLIQWFDSATPALSGLLQSVVAGQGVIAPTLITNKEYIKVLYDKTHMLSPSAGGDSTVTGDGIIDPVTVYIPGRRLRPIKYNSGTNVVQDGNLYLVAISDDTALSTVNLTWYSRVTFADQ